MTVQVSIFTSKLSDTWIGRSLTSHSSVSDDKAKKWTILSRLSYLVCINRCTCLLNVGFEVQF